LVPKPLIFSPANPKRHKMKFEPGQYLYIHFKEKFFLAIQLKMIVGVYPRGEITPIPNLKEEILGLANLEGKIVPIQDTVKRFRLKISESEGPYIVLIKTYMGEVGLLVPREFEVVQISKEQIDEAIKSSSEEDIFLVIPGPEKNMILIDLMAPVKYGEMDARLIKKFGQSN